MKSDSRASLRGLRTFCVAARYESFKAAADELFITSSAVSQQVKALEEELGLKLFERGTRELSLSEPGQALFAELSPLIDQLDGVVADFKTSGRRRLSEFTALHPEIEIQVGTSDEASEKLPADADLSIRLFREPPAGTRSDVLFPLRMVPSGSAQFRKDLEVNDEKIVSDFPLIVHEARPKALPDNPKVTRLSSMIAVVRAAEQGIGAALVPVPLADQWFRQGTIVRLFEHALVTDLSYFLVSRKDRAANEALALLRRWILERFAEKP
jgi:LysR family glycine cleavage system transcriptional activator